MRPALDRLLAKVRYDRGCWSFTGAIDAHGYGRLNIGGTSALAHRVAFENLVGPAGSADLDHLCRNPSCVNPDHLEPVSQSENLLRGARRAASLAKTHCPKGHDLTPENTRNRPGKGRECRECARDYLRAYKRRAA